VTRLTQWTASAPQATVFSSKSWKCDGSQVSDKPGLSGPSGYSHATKQMRQT